MKKISFIFTTSLFVLGCLAFGLLLVSSGAQASQEAKEVQHDVYGTVRGIEGSTLTIETRAKKIIYVDIKSAVEGHRSVVMVVGRAVVVHGAYDAKGTLHASAVQRAKDSASLWPEDK